MTVPLYITNTSAFGISELNENKVINLCYEIHGRDGEYFNLVSDSCVSVNAHYMEAHQLLRNNIIDEITVLTVGLDRVCKNVSVSVSGCRVSVDGTFISSTYSSAGISIRIYENRIRITAPNCQDVDLVMWVFCKQTTLKGSPEQGEGNITVGVDVLHFVIIRGLNIRETTHGLLGEQTIPPSYTPQILF